VVACGTGVGAATVDLEGSCFLNSAGALLESNPDAELMLARERQTGSSQSATTRYTLRCQHCAHGRLHTVDILALLGEETFAQIQQLCSDAQAQAARENAPDASGERTDLLSRNVSMTLSQGSAGDTVVVVQEWERRPMLDFRRDPSAADDNFYSKATLLPTDPHPWASRNGSPCAKEEPRLLLPGWHWESEWRPAVDAGGSTDAEGWQYTFGAGPQAWKPHHLESTPGVKPWQVTFLRRRRWERKIAPPPLGSLFAYTEATLSRPLPKHPPAPANVDAPHFEERFQVALRREPFLQDTESPRCGVCTAVFKLDRRRHHCRSCGDVVCIGCWVNSVVDVLQWEWCRICSVRDPSNLIQILTSLCLRPRTALTDRA
jgi:hypothetical protein